MTPYAPFQLYVSLISLSAHLHLWNSEEKVKYLFNAFANQLVVLQKSKIK